MSEVYSFRSPRVPGDTSSFTFLFTADAGIGAVPDNQKGGAIHNDPPVNGADQVQMPKANKFLSDRFSFLMPCVSPCFLLICKGRCCHAAGPSQSRYRRGRHVVRDLLMCTHSHSLCNKFLHNQMMNSCCSTETSHMHVVGHGFGSDTST